MRTVVLTFIALLAALPTCAQDPLPPVPSGRVERLAAFPSRFVDARNIDVWLPNGYTPAKRYRVLYMHDGQALFSDQGSVSHRSWRAADTVARLIEQGKLGGLIVVGIWNNGRCRHSEYFPQKALVHLPAAARREFVDKMLAGSPRADRYLRFIVEELKPAIDRKFATLADRDDTFIMGYMDHGTQGLDTYYAVPQQFFDLMMHDRGYSDLNYESRVFPGAAHDEGAWAARLDGALTFVAAR